MKKARRILYWSLAGAVALAAAGVAAGPITSRVEQPAYTVLQSNGPIELRVYGSMIAAEVIMQGDRSSVLSEGFRLIAAYIFGANTPRATLGETTPVEQGSLKISMTAPVIQQADGGSWIVRFIMPREWTMATLPAPRDSRVTLEAVAERTMLAIRFAGRASGSLIAEKTDELRQYALDHGVRLSGEPVLAFYNPPWTLPFLRRNEILLQVEYR